MQIAVLGAQAGNCGMTLQQNICRKLLYVFYFHRHLKDGDVLSIYRCCLYCIVEIELSVASITICAVLAPWLDQL